MTDGCAEGGINGVAVIGAIVCANATAGST